MSAMLDSDCQKNNDDLNWSEFSRAKNPEEKGYIACGFFIIICI